MCASVAERAQDGRSGEGNLAADGRLLSSRPRRLAAPSGTCKLVATLRRNLLRCIPNCLASTVSLTMPTCFSSAISSAKQTPPSAALDVN